MIDNEFQDYQGTMTTLSTIVVIVLTALFLFIITLYKINGNFIMTQQQAFQKALSDATIAYSKQYNYSFTNLQSISEGYLNVEDLEKYSKESNPVSLDLNKASNYFYEILSGNTSFTQAELKRMELYMVTITTTFATNGTPTYVVSIHRNGINPVVQNMRYNSLDALQDLLETTLGVNLDINKNYNNSIRKAQEYKREGAGSDNSKKTYSTYNTYMVVGKNINMSNLVGQQTDGLYEIQSYSIKR